MFWRKGREKYKQKYKKLTNDSLNKQSNRNLESEIKVQNDSNYSTNSNNIILINNKSPIPNSNLKINVTKELKNQLEYQRFRNKMDTFKLRKLKDSKTHNQISNNENFEKDKLISLQEKHINNKNINESNLNNNQTIMTNKQSKYISIIKILPNNHNINSYAEMKKYNIKFDEYKIKKNSILKNDGNKDDLLKKSKLKNKTKFAYKRIDFKNFFIKENFQSISNLLIRKKKKNDFIISIKNQNQFKNKSFIKNDKNNFDKYKNLFLKNRNDDNDGGIIEISKIKKTNCFEMNVIKIQKFIRGYLLRKRFLFLIEYIIYYKGFCDIIQNILNFKIKQYVFNKLFRKRSIKEILIEMIKNEKYVLHRWVNIWKQISQKEKRKAIIKRIFYIYERNDLKKGKIKQKFMDLWLRKVMNIKLNEKKCLKEIDNKIYNQIQQKNLLNNDINFKKDKNEMNNKGVRILIMQKKFQQYSLKSLILKKIKDTKRNIFNLWKRNQKKSFDNNINKDEINEVKKLENKNSKGQLKKINLIENSNKFLNENKEINNLEINEIKNETMEMDSQRKNKSKILIEKINSIISKNYKKKLINRLIWISRIKTLKILIRNMSVYFEDSNLIHYFNIWREKSSFEMIKKTKKIQKYFKYYFSIKKNNKKIYMINLLKNILQKKQKREELNILSSLKRWKKNCVLSSLENPGNRINHVIKKYLLKKKNKSPKYEIEQIFTEEVKPSYNKINKDYYYNNEIKLNEKDKKNNNKPQFIDSETQIDINMINPGNEIHNNKLFINNFPKKIKKNENDEFLKEITSMNSIPQKKKLYMKYYSDNLNEKSSIKKNENNYESDKPVFNKENIKQLKNKNYKINSYYFKIDGKNRNKTLSKKTNDISINKHLSSQK